MRFYSNRNLCLKRLEGPVLIQPFDGALLHILCFVYIQDAIEQMCFFHWNIIFFTSSDLRATFGEFYLLRGQICVSTITIHIKGKKYTKTKQVLALPWGSDLNNNIPLCMSVDRVPLCARRMWQPSRQWWSVSDGLLSRGLLWKPVRPDGQTLQLWLAAHWLPHQRNLCFQWTVAHVRDVEVKSAQQFHWPHKEAFWRMYQFFFGSDFL